MSWVKLDDRYRTHPKLVRAGAEARALDVAGMCYCAELLTDGHIESDMLESLAPELVKGFRKAIVALVRVGRWHQHGHDCPRCPQIPSGDVYLHDYLAYNPTRESVIAKREADRKRKEEGMKSGRNPHGIQAESEDTDDGSFASPSPSRSPSLDGDIKSQERFHNLADFDALVTRLAGVCRDANADEAHEVLGVVLLHVSVLMVDEAVGYMAGLKSPPRHPRYLLGVIQQWAPQREVEVPDLMAQWQATRKASA